MILRSLGKLIRAALLALVLGAALLAVPAKAGTGTIGDPFTALSEAYSVPASGRYYFNLGSGTFAADIDTSEGGGWVLVLQYVHAGGTNPPLTVLGAGANLPVTSAAALGADESAIAARWGHAGNAAMSQFTGDIETRWYGITSAHGRVIHFRTSLGDDYFRTGSGSMVGLQSSFTALSQHSAFIPGAVDSYADSKLDYAMTNFPFFRTGQYHWGVRGQSSTALGNNGDRWEVDNVPLNSANSTIHRVWVRASQSPFVVTNTNDSGAGSLRAAVDAANANSGPNTVSFAIPGPGPHTINLSTPLPPLLGNNDTIDGTTQPGASCGDLWAGTPPNLLINLNAGTIGTGLHLEAASLTVRGLSITGFTNKVYIHPFASNVNLRCNYIGLYPDGRRGPGNSPGVVIEGPGTVVGNTNPGDGNVISGNTVAVWTLNGSTNTAVRGNFIGTDPTGMSAIANDRGINNQSGNSSWRDITRNLIAGSTFSEISIDDNDTVTASNGLIRIQSNVIGYNRTVSAKLQAGSASAILFAPSSISNVLIGGDTTEGNVIGALQSGIEIRNGANITIQGNTIAGSGADGVILDRVNSATIGGTLAGLGNIIGGNGRNGVLLRNGASGITILGNTIGPATIAGGTFNNGGHAIFLNGVSNITIGDGSAAGRNVINGNGWRAILATGVLSGITIAGNYIGTDASGNVVLANGQNEVGANSDAISFLGATLTNLTVRNNVIGGYGAAMLELSGSNGNGIAIQGNHLGMGADGATPIVSGNVEDLLSIGSGAYSNMLIGGSAPGEGNLIAFGARSGIRLQSSGNNIQVSGNTIRNNGGNGIHLVAPTIASIYNNAIWSNGGLGIDLGGDGVTQNDPGDGDSGANNLLNFPVFSGLNVTASGNLAYAFTLDAPAEPNGYRIDFYRNGSADPTGHGEGERWLGFIDTPAHPGGAVTYSGSFTPDTAIANNDRISATTTRKTGASAYAETSEFNQNANVVSPLTVTNTNNSGAGSLREAVLAANAGSGPDTISFNIPGPGPHTITLSTALPPMLGNNDTIDGATQPGASCGDLWAGTPPTLLIHLNGGAISTGLHLQAASLTVRGLAITGFTNRIFVHPLASNASIRCNYIGLSPDGTSGPRNLYGVYVQGAGTVVGGLNPGDGNVISGTRVGVLTRNGSTDTAVRGNFIGTDPTGMIAIGNERGINNETGTGSWRDITRNLIAGNTFGEINIDSDDTVTASNGLIRIQSNVLGYNRTLSAKLQVGSWSAIRFVTGSISNVLIGGDTTEGNVIGALPSGIEILNGANISIQGNTIAGSGGDGIRLTNVKGATIGGTSASLRNIIGGNGGSGVLLGAGSTNIAIAGNTIGTATIAGVTAGNQGNGIALNNVSNITIGDGNLGGRNIISGNGSRAIEGQGNVSAVFIAGNYIGIDASGNVAVANGWNMAPNLRDAITFINATISSLSIQSNIIGGYEAALVTIWQSSGSGVTVRSNGLGIGVDGVSATTSANIEPLLHIGGGTSLSNLLIGGTGDSEGNIIAMGGNAGIELGMSSGDAQIIGNTIRNNAAAGIRLLDPTRAAIISNRIFGNGGLGIDLNRNGVTANDPGDGDSGSNDLLNFPQAIRAIVTGANQLGYSFTLEAPTAANGYRIEFFASAAADPSGHGEGERYLGAVDISHAGGVQSYTGTLTTLEPISIGDIISATTTRRTAGGSWDITSEFSAVATADGVAALSVTMASELFDPPAGQAFFTPGNDVLVTATIGNGGNGSTDPDSLFVGIAIDQGNAFFNDVTALFGGVIGFESGAPSLTFTPATDLRFSNAVAAPASFAQCTYTPAPGYDPQVRHVCLNPKGTLPSGAPQGQFAVRLRARIN